MYSLLSFGRAAIAEEIVPYCPAVGVGATINVAAAEAEAEADTDALDTVADSVAESVAEDEVVICVYTDCGQPEKGAIAAESSQLSSPSTFLML